MLYTLGLVILFASCTLAENSYKVFRIFPENESQLKILYKLQDDFKSFSFWKPPSTLMRVTDVMVAPIKINEFIETMNSNDFRYEVYVHDVQTLITNSANSGIRNLDGSLGWKSYYNLNEIYDWMHQITKRYPQFIREIEIGMSFEKRPIKGLILSYGLESKPGIVIEGGIHPQEWISPATVTYLLNQLLTMNDRFVAKMAQKYVWYIFPVINPDGYAFTHKNPISIVNRLWRKTRSDNNIGPRKSNCKGTDLNHNWASNWSNLESQSDPCSENYAGWARFSEIESRSLSGFLNSISSKLFAYFSFRGYGQTLMFPSECPLKGPFNCKQQLKIAKKAVQALRKPYGKNYIPGSLNNLTGCPTGTSIQWVQSEFKLPLVFDYEMRDTGNYGFFLPPDEITPNGQEITQSLIALLLKAEEFGDFHKMLSSTERYLR